MLGAIVAFAGLAAPQGLPIDLAGGYAAGSRSGSLTGEAAATTGLGQPEGQVFERSGGVVISPEGALTPFSDAQKTPLHFTASYAGRSLIAWLDLGARVRWAIPNGTPGTTSTGDFFQFGLGTRAVTSNANREVWVSAYRTFLTGEYAISLQTNGSAFGPTYNAPFAGGQTRFRVEVRFNGAGSAAELRVTPENGSGSGVEVIAGTLTLDGANDVIANAPVFAAFLSFELESRAQATVNRIETNAGLNHLYLYSIDPYARPGDVVPVQVGMANLGQGVLGFQAFLALTNPPAATFLSGEYTPTPFQNPIIDPITSALDMASGRNPGDPPTSADAILAELRFVGAVPGVTQVRFRPNNPPSRLADGNGSQFSTSLVDANRVIVDNRPPTVSIVGAFQGVDDVLGGAEPQPGALEIRVAASDGGSAFSGLAGPPTVRVVYPGGFGSEEPLVYTGAGSSFAGRVNLTNLIPCGVATIEVTARDDAGNVTTRAANFVTDPLSTVFASEFFVRNGALAGGGLNELRRSDDQRLVINQRFPFSAADPNARLEVRGTFTTRLIDSILFVYEGSATGVPSSAFIQRIEFFNFVTNAWELVDERAPTTFDSVVNIEIATNPTRFLDTDNAVRARISLFDRGGLTPNYALRVDRAIWRACRP
jgi:hypothetical protein